jgi:hypothetical protein
LAQILAEVASTHLERLRFCNLSTTGYL